MSESNGTDPKDLKEEIRKFIEDNIEIGNNLPNFLSNEEDKESPPPEE